MGWASIPPPPGAAGCLRTALRRVHCSAEPRKLHYLPPLVAQSCIAPPLDRSSALFTRPPRSSSQPIGLPPSVTFIYSSQLSVHSKLPQSSTTPPPHPRPSRPRIITALQQRAGGFSSIVVVCAASASVPSRLRWNNHVSLGEDDTQTVWGGGGGGVAMSSAHHPTSAQTCL